MEKRWVMVTARRGDPEKTAAFLNQHKITPGDVLSLGHQVPLGTYMHLLVYTDQDLPRHVPLSG